MRSVEPWPSTHCGRFRVVGSMCEISPAAGPWTQWHHIDGMLCPHRVRCVWVVMRRSCEDMALQAARGRCSRCLCWCCCPCRYRMPHQRLSSDCPALIALPILASARSGSAPARSSLSRVATARIGTLQHRRCGHRTHARCRSSPAGPQTTTVCHPQHQQRGGGPG